MTNEHVEIGHGSHHSAHWLTALASLTVGACFFALWFWLLPAWLGFHVDASGSGRWRWIAAIPSVLGFAVALRCVFDFGWTGHGTPAPMIPPQRLVVVGFYRYVRNPMYVGFFTGWFGLWTVFGRANSSAFTIALIAVSAVALFVRLYEEPILLTTKPTARMSRAGSPGCAPGTHERLRISRGSRPFAT
ncbi:MAG TPA: methyltransferase [Candidatus Acidoferrum sp.]|nr:methyltransferase [Candidatus Acidoferrum sp.]